MVYTQGIVAKLSIHLKLELPAESITIINSRGVCTTLLFEIVKVLQKVILKLIFLFSRRKTF